MAHVKFSLGSLPELEDAKVSLAFKKETELAVKDCRDRPLEKTARKVTLELFIFPKISDDSVAGAVVCDGVEGYFEIKGKTPVRRSKTYDFKINSQGDMIFNSNNPTNFDQMTFDDIGEEQ